MNRYKGTFIYSHRVTVLYRKARSLRQAWVLMCQALAEKDDVEPELVFSLFPWEKKGETFKITPMDVKIWKQRTSGH